MKKITITALNILGEVALKEHHEESRKLKLIHRLTFKQMGYKQFVLSQKPFTLVLEINNPYFQMVLKENDMLRKITEALLEKKVTKDKDYIVKIE